MITWDERKRKKVIKDHGVDLAKIEDVFDDQFALEYEDFGHSDSEERRIVVGKSSVYGLVSVVYIFEDEDIRLITARRAERWLTRLYEEQKHRS